VPPLPPTALTPPLGGAPPDPAGGRAADEARLRATVEQAPVGIVHLAADGAVLFANEAFCRLVGRTRAELDGLTFAALTHPDDVAAQRAGFERLLRGESDVFRATGRHVRRDGSIVWGELTARHVRERGPPRRRGRGGLRARRGARRRRAAAPRGRGGVGRRAAQEQATELELTNETLQEQAVELEAANEQLRETQFALEARSERLASANAALAATADELAEREARWHTLAEAMPQLVWTCRADGWSDFSNQRWLDYTGQRQEETWGLGWMDVMHPRRSRAPTLAAWEPAVARGSAFESYYRLRRAADGAYRWFLAPRHAAARRPGTITRLVRQLYRRARRASAAEERETLLAAEREARAAPRRPRRASASSPTRASCSPGRSTSRPRCARWRRSPCRRSPTGAPSTS
jgi:PAS domain S-box-containing protein